MKELNDNNFKEEIEKSKLALVDFYAVWCGPCGMQSEILNRMESSRSLKFDIMKVNVDEAESISRDYNIQSIPTLIIFKNNECVKTIVGLTSEDEIMQIMQEYEE